MVIGNLSFWSLKEAIESISCLPMIHDWNLPLSLRSRVRMTIFSLLPTNLFRLSSIATKWRSFV